MWKQIKEKNEQRGQLLADMKKILNTVETEKRDLSAEENTKFNDLNTRAEALQVDIERLNKVYSVEQAATAFNGAQNRNQPERDDITTPEQRTDAAALESRAQFDRYLRTGVKNQPGENRALTVAGAGVVGDRPFYSQLIEVLKAYAGVRQAGATVQSSSNGNPLSVGVIDDTSNTGRLVGEAASNTNQTTPVLSTVTLNAYKFDSDWIPISIELAQDAAYPLESTILAQAGERIGRAQNSYFTTGTGSNQPTGFVTAAAVGKTTVSTSAATYDELIDLIHSVDAAYRASGKCRLQLHDTTLATIRKFKDNSGRYIWSPAFSAQNPNAGPNGNGIQGYILDFPYVVNNSMAQLSSGAGSIVAAFGDFSRYFIHDVTQTVIVRADELFAGNGLFAYRVWQRADGNLIDANAVKTLALHA